jgi:hypothetical protein
VVLRRKGHLTAVGLGIAIVYGLGLLAVLGVVGTVAVRRLRGGTSAELLPHRAVPAPVVITLLCLCFPVPFVAWIPLWTARVVRGDGTSWSIPWKLAFTVSPLVPIVLAAWVLSSLGFVGTGQTGLSLLAPLFVLGVALTDLLFHRRPPPPGA